VVEPSNNIDLYDRHPINADQILEAAGQAGKKIENFAPIDLRPHDQDHYGGEAVVHALADAICVADGDVIADVCAGMAGPARLVAESRGASVIGLDYNWGRCSGAAYLNRIVGLDDEVRMVRCDAQALPLATNSINGAISQEALLHIPDKQAVLTGVFAALNPGGRFAFTDLVANESLSPNDRVRLATEGMQMVTLLTPENYRSCALATGFEIEAETDLSNDWIEILTERLAMYDAMAEATAKVHGAKAHGQYMGPYAFFVRLVQQGRLGGIRLVLRKPEI
jgi:sarcosine/dimethylglycine N-methyltransferase